MLISGLPEELRKRVEASPKRPAVAGNPYEFVQLGDELRRDLARHAGVGLHVINGLANVTTDEILFNAK
jgi:hypothetical protein